MEISPQQTKIGWIGTGVMGRSMCGHLLKAGYQATVFNRTKAKAAELIEQGAALGRFAARRGRGFRRCLFHRGSARRRARCVAWRRGGVGWVSSR